MTKKPPISLTWQAYSGTNEHHHNAANRAKTVAKAIEVYLNKNMRDAPQTKTILEIANDLSLSQPDVRESLSRNGYGFSGITF